MKHPYLLLTLSVLFWAGNWVAGRVLADLFPPAALTFWRWAIALALLAPFVAPRLWAARTLLVQKWKPIVLIGLLGGGLHNVLQYWGMQLTSATNGSILNSLTPVFIILLGAAVLRERFPRAAAAGAAVALAGALAIVTRLDWQAIAALRWRPQGLDALSFLACFAIVAEVPVGVLYLFEKESIVWNATSVLGLAYVAVFPALLAYYFWSLGVAAVGAARAGVFLYLTPVFGSLMGALLLGEEFGLHHALGMALIVAGVTIASRKWAG